jgi:tetratricopeptide (TPR) repeat protein
VNVFDWLFRRKPSSGTSQSGRPRTAPTPSRGCEHFATFAALEKRPFDTIAEALAASQANDPTRAERLFEQGIEAYKSSEPSGVDFALGRYGAFLLDQGRKDEALRILKQAIDRKTDIPAIWSDYLRILSDRRDLDAFKSGIELMTVAVKSRVEPEIVLVHARRADREGAPAFAEAIAQWVAEKAAS